MRTTALGWCLLIACSGADDPGGSVLELHGGPTRVGAYVAPTLGQAAAARVHLDPAFVATFSGNAYAQPLFVDGKGGRDLVIAASEADQVTAFDAATGAIAWQTTLGTPQPMPNPAEGANCGNIDPLGITGTPVIDHARRTLYVAAMVRDGNAAHHRIFALSIDGGTIQPGWPVDVGASVTFNGVPFVPAPHGQRGGLALVGGRVYVPYGGHAGDCGTYHGWVVSVPVDAPARPTAWATIDTFSGIWNPGGLSSDGTSIFAVTGNGNGLDAWGNSEAIIRLGAGATFSNQTKDYWVPTDWQSLDARDLDLGGSPALVIDVAGATPSALVAAFAKTGIVYLVSRDDLGGISAPLAALPASDTSIINTSASYRTARASYLVFRGHGLPGCPGVTATSTVVALRIVAGAPPTLEFAWCAEGHGTGSPIATTIDGSRDAIVWVVGAEGDQRLHGFDGDTGAIVYDGGGAGDAMASTSRFVTPIVAKGQLFVAGNGQLYRFLTN